MGIGRWLGGREEPGESRTSRSTPGPQPGEQLSDEQAIERYRYMLRTAPPEAIEQAHAEAFAQLTDRQRRMVLEQLREITPERERAAAAADPQTLARLATRAELRQPGVLERTFGGAGAMGGPGFGGILAGSFLSSLAGTVVGSMIARQFLGNTLDQEAAGESQSDPDHATSEHDTHTEDDSHLAGDFDADVGGDFDVDV
jgi:hypothetical protein